MRTLLGVFLSLALLVTSLPGSAAQGNGSPLGDGIGQTVIYTDAEGNDLAELTVTEVDNDFQGFMDGQYADHGYSYRLVSFTLENISEESFIASLSTFTLIDSLGNSHYLEYLPVDEDSEYESDFAIGGGEVMSHDLVFMLPAHADTAMFRWQPDFETSVFVLLQQPGDGAVARGLRAPAAVTDDFGNVIATVQVTAVSRGWDQHSEWSSPEAGGVYWAVRIIVTNDSDRPVAVQPYRFNLINQDGRVLRSAYVSGSEEMQNQILGTEELNPGESIEALVIYEMAEDDKPIALQWSNRFSSTAVIILVGEGDSGESVPVTPDEEATPTGG